METLLAEIRKLAERRGYRVEGEGDTLLVIHPHVPALRLVMRVVGDRLEMRLASDELRDYIDDLVEERGAEEARDMIEEALDDISEFSAQVEVLAKKRGLRVDNMVRSGALDVLDALEDVLES